MKKATRHILSYFLALTVLLSAFPLSAVVLNIKSHAEDTSLSYEGKCGENIYWFFYTETGLLELKGEGALYDYEDSVSPFYACADIKAVSVSHGITAICNGAFSCCSNLASISLPDTLTMIADDSFYECTSLKSIDIPDNVDIIGESAFEGSGIVEISIPSSIKVIEKFTFSGCSALERISIPKSVTEIKRNAFSGCDKLSAVFYEGSEDDRSNISVGYKNEALKNAKIYFSCDGMHNHVYAQEVTVPAACTSDGVMTYTCECGKSYTEVINGGHLWSEWQYYSEEKDVRGCLRCGEAEYREREISSDTTFSLNIVEETESYIILGIRLDGGSFYGVDLRVAPESDNIGECEEICETDYFLSFCTEVKKDSQITVSNWSRESFMYSFASTVPFYSSEENIILYKFSKNTAETVNNRDFDFNVRFCFSEYETAIKCTIINNLPETLNHIHSYTRTLTKAETCTENGRYTYTCECGDSYDEIIPAEHKYIHKKTPASYSVDGFEYDVCLVCYNVINYRTVSCFTKYVKEINGALIDFDDRKIYGFAPGSRNIYDYLHPLSDTVTVTANTDVIGTGTKISIFDNGRIKFSFNAVVYGDVNGDGMYDGIDAFIVNLFVNGILCPNDIQRIAADCNHDGNIDITDVEILENAGVLLNEISQNDSEELETSSTYSEYIGLIDRTNENTEISNKKCDFTAIIRKIYEKIILFFRHTFKK